MLCGIRSCSHDWDAYGGGRGPKDDEVFEEITVNGEEKSKMRVLEWYSAYSWEEEKQAERQKGQPVS